VAGVIPDEAAEGGKEVTMQRMKNKYIIVRSGSTTGPYVVERNECAPWVICWTKAEVAGYADTIREARRIAAKANRGEPLSDWEEWEEICRTVFPVYRGVWRK
jgi:hypothetical protein